MWQAWVPVRKLTATVVVPANPPLAIETFVDALTNGTLARDLLARGGLDLTETFIDATFAGAREGALQLVRQSAAKGARSWQSQTAMVFLSPCTWPALRLMKADWSKPRSMPDSRGKFPQGRLGIYIAYDSDPLAGPGLLAYIVTSKFSDYVVLAVM